MKANLEIHGDIYTLHISAESDVEDIALRAWSERYFSDTLPREDARAVLLLSLTPGAAAPAGDATGTAGEV